MAVVKVFYCSVSNTRQVWIRKSLFVKTKGRYHRCRLIVCHGSKLDVAGEQLGNAVLDLVSTVISTSHGTTLCPTSSSVTNWEAQKLRPLIFCARSDRLAQVNLKKLSETLTRSDFLVHGGLLWDRSSHQGGGTLRNGSADGLRVVKTGFYTPDLSQQFDYFISQHLAFNIQRIPVIQDTKGVQEHKTRSESKRNHAMVQRSLLLP